MSEDKRKSQIKMEIFGDICSICLLLLLLLLLLVLLQLLLIIITYLARCPKGALGRTAGTLIFYQVKVTHFLKSLEYKNETQTRIIASRPRDLATSDLIGYVQGQRMTE